ncbi:MULTISPECIES: hypothetical protein [unclassified Pedobacter]|uniref:hypothetical protein n=1 Tax=unclassified Pedobacter TaxID=2628915 RepID=UPI00141DE441|nr:MULTISPECIES: hypothetical protein [unclassified Pedobacter]NII81746.1 hypothetical protein [Pedobacter sp. SG908]NMN35749.1 hypothetical protein [Pedobacter sp. SG918]
MISITADFNFNDLDKVIEYETQKWFDALVDDYRQTGIRFVERAVAKASFNNITWNLRSSIGYLIIWNGEVLESYFKDLKDGTEGQEVGRDYALFVAKLIDEGEGLAMALVAGEEYAAFVESKGKDVISGSSAYFETEIKALLK